MILKHRWAYWLFFLSCSVVSLLLFTTPSQANEDCGVHACNIETQDENAYLSCINAKKTCLESKISSIQSEKITLQNSISLINSKINLQEVKISQLNAEIALLERQITELGERITGLNFSLDRLTTILVERMRTQYKHSNVNPLFLLAKANSFNQFATNYKYISLAGKQTAHAMQRAEDARIAYDQQKLLKEAKQTEVTAKQEVLKVEQTALANQRQDQQYLLKETRNDEMKYQAELQRTLAELVAIQSIIAGKGQEAKVGPVKTGDAIATIILGASPCSNGTHLHFEVVQNGVNRNPANFLKPITAQWNNSPDGTFSFDGGWEWPVHDPAKINQGYGMTHYARVRRAYGGSPHTGIDMASKSQNLTVRAVQDGELSRGSIKCGSGQLRYVKVAHTENDIATFYLHVNY